MRRPVSAFTMDPPHTGVKSFLVEMHERVRFDRRYRSSYAEYVPPAIAGVAQVVRATVS